jgi:hypothetical protein
LRLKKLKNLKKRSLIKIPSLSHQINLKWIPFQ